MKTLSVLPGEAKGKLNQLLSTCLSQQLSLCILKWFVLFDAASLNVNFGTPQVVRSTAGWCALRDASPTANAPVRWVDCTSRPMFSASWQILRSDSVSGHEGSRLCPGHWAFFDQSLVVWSVCIHDMWMLLTLAPACFCHCFFSFFFCLACEKALTSL